MPVSSVDIAMLSSPLSPQSTSHVGSTFSQSDYTQKQSIAGTNGGGNQNGGIPTHQLLASDASSIQISADIDAVNQSKELESPGIPGRDYDQNAIAGEAQTTVGGNVGGVVADAEKAGPAFVPEERDLIEEQTWEFEDADEEGFQRTNKKGELVGKEHTGRRGARKAKKQDRKEDRWTRQGRILDEETGEWSDKGEGDRLRGSEKRQERRRNRQDRGDSWDDYKDAVD